MPPALLLPPYPADKSPPSALIPRAAIAPGAPASPPLTHSCGPLQVPLTLTVQRQFAVDMFTLAPAPPPPPATAQSVSSANTSAVAPPPPAPPYMPLLGTEDEAFILPIITLKGSPAASILVTTKATPLPPGVRPM
jgi:hypothetical protein